MPLSRSNRARGWAVLVVAAVLAVAVCGLVASQESGQPHVFDLPAVQARLAAAHSQAGAALTARQYVLAEKILTRCVEQMPHDSLAHYNLACALARQGKTKPALNSLQLAVKFGFRNPGHIKADADLTSLHESPEFTAALELARKPIEGPVSSWTYPLKAAEPVDGKMVIGEENAAWTTKIGMFRVPVKFAATTDAEVVKGRSQSKDLLRKWYQEGTAAGNHGDLYDNHDRDHSNMAFGSFPQLTRVEYSEAAKKRSLDHGLQRHFLFNTVTIGNSSTAVTSGLFWRSQPRLAMTQPGGVDRMHLQYRTNHLYFYPEHRDHDPGHNGADGGYGDVYPLNTPYLIVSQGSSGSDRVFMDAVAQTLAAFQPAVKKRLQETGTLMPAVQMIFRSSNKNVESPQDYLTGKAHPAVFDGKQLNVVKMVRQAHDLQLESLPPLVQLEVVEEQEGRLGIDYFDVGPREKLCDTPSAIGRVFKTTQFSRRIVVSAEKSIDVNDKPLTYHWVVLRGDNDRIQIQKSNDTGSIVSLTISHHSRDAVSKDQPIGSNRVDIGVFAHNGVHYSAPAFVSCYFLDNERRVYDDQQRIQVVDYTGAHRANYVDPVIDQPKDWRDEYHYDDDGKLAGWTRIRGEQREKFTPDGRLIVKADAHGRPEKTAAVRYVSKRDGRSIKLIQEAVEAVEADEAVEVP